jgi:hypothetical protein
MAGMNSRMVSPIPLDKRFMNTSGRQVYTI